MVMRKILWVAPNLNHYKIRFLEKLHGNFFDIIVIAGAEESELGHKTQKMDNIKLKITRLSATKSTFQSSPAVYASLWRTIRKDMPDVVLMPCEKKHLFVILYLSVIRRIYPFMLVTYTHPLMRSRGLKYKYINRLLTKALFGLYDRIIFYTQQAMQRAVECGLLPKRKAAYANNTLDTDAINEVYEYSLPPDEPRILFIGRLIPSKRVDLLMRYYGEIKKQIPLLKLVIIGDGPESEQIIKEQEKDGDIIYKGAVVEEAIISDEMRAAQIVFLPGLSGLSIVHAFSYGRPFVTIDNENHGPELAYLQDGYNGLILEGNMKNDVSRLAHLLQSKELLVTYSCNAYLTSKKLSIEHWCNQVNAALYSL